MTEGREKHSRFIDGLVAIAGLVVGLALFDFAAHLFVTYFGAQQ